MGKRLLVIIDTETGFVDRFQENLEVNDINDYQIVKIIPNTRLDPSERIRKCKEELQQFLNTDEVAAVFIDIVVVETGEEDTSGIKIATELKKQYAGLPIFNVTSKHSNPFERDAISQASLEKIDGVFIKSYLDEKTFSESRLKQILRKAREKREYQNQEFVLPIDIRIPEGIDAAFSIVDPRVKHQIDEIGANVFWTLVSKLQSGASGTISYMRPGRSGAYVFRWFANTPTTLPKSWVLKVSKNPDSLQTELDNYIKLRNTPFPKTRFPQIMSEEVIKVGKFGAIMIELEAEAETLKNTFQKLDSANIGAVLNGINEFFVSTYGDPVRNPFHVWQFYDLNEPLINEILGVMSSFKDVYESLFDKNEFSNVFSFVKKEGELFQKINSYETNVDQRTIHGDFNAGNILVKPNGEIIVIDFSLRDKNHVVKDVAKLERDIVFRIYDADSYLNFDWSRLEHWENFSLLHENNDFFEEQFKAVKNQPQLNNAMMFIKGLRKSLKNISNTTTKQEYLCSLLRYSFLAIIHPDFSFQKRIFAVKYINSILSQF